jgi:Secretion system C-terminal sorting domain
MKNKFSISVVAVLLLFSLFSHAQSVMVVTPGYGTLNDAINANKGTKIYQLTAGEWYGLTGPIENVDYHLQIIGSEPSVAGGLPATLQTGQTLDGVPFYTMFDSKGDITLKNIYIQNADVNSVLGNIFLTESKNNARVIVDRCVILPVGSGAGIYGTGGNIKTYFTNNQVFNHGQQTTPNDGHFFSFGNSSGLGIDTLFVENNTFVCMGTTMFDAAWDRYINNFVAFNHNTLCMNKSQIDWAVFKKEQYWTNNLMFDVMTQPWASAWQPMAGADPTMPKPNLIYTAPLKDEVLPTSRLNLVQYNSHYRAKGFYDLITELNAYCVSKNKGMYVYLQPLVWSKDSTNCREAQMFNSTNFPNFKYGNTITNVDPQWVDAKIYQHEANFVAWTRPATYTHALNDPLPNFPQNTWAQWWWNPFGELGGDNSKAWPVFDGRYTNPQTLTGAIETNVPLGDLNWFPKAKTAFMAKHAEIWAHMKAGNTGKINIGYSPTGINTVKTDAFSLFPNPAKDILIINGTKNADVTIHALDGRIVKSANNVSQVNISELPNGTYLVTIKEGVRVANQKMVIAR